MCQLELTSEEQRLLTQTLERRVRDLELEILHTDRAEFKRVLKTQQAGLQQLLNRLNRPSAIAA